MSNDQSNTNDISDTDPSSVKSTTREYTVNADLASYDSVINVYQKIVEILAFDRERYDTDLYTSMFSFPSDEQRDIFGQLKDSVFLFCPDKDAVLISDYGYAIKDLNGDGIDELVLLMKDYTVLAVFSSNDGIPTLIDRSFWHKYRAYIDSEGNICIISSGGAMVFSRSKYKIRAGGTGLVLKDEIGADNIEAEQSGSDTPYYKNISGKRVRKRD